MATLSRSSRHKHDNHDWESLAYVSHWAEGQDKKEAVRQEPFRVLAQTIPYDKGLPIKILDVGAGYGALTQFLLGFFPNATAICQDGSQEMMKMGHQRMASYEGRFKYVQSDFGKSGWSQGLARPFEAVVSSIAIAPTDNTHRHFGKGQTEATLNLPQGDYRLTLQFADGLHRSYGEKLSATINIKVASR